MDVIVWNQTKESSWMRYKTQFKQIADRAMKELALTKQLACSVIFVDDEQIHKINQEYRNKDMPTDVISFALMDTQDEFDWTEVDEAQELGDIFINVDAVRRQSREYEHTVKREVCFLFAHGLLHLLGYDHMEAKDEKTMFALQDVLLEGIAVKRHRRYVDE